MKIEASGDQDKMLHGRSGGQTTAYRKSEKIANTLRL